MYSLLKKLKALLRRLAILAHGVFQKVAVIGLPSILISGLVFGADEKAVFLDGRGMAWECVFQKRLDVVEALIGPCEPHLGELGSKGTKQLDASDEASVEAGDPGSGEVTNQPARDGGHNVTQDLWDRWAAFDSHGYITSFVLYALAGFLVALWLPPGLVNFRNSDYFVAHCPLPLRFRVSPPIRKTLPTDPLKQFFRAHRVIKPELLAMVVTEVKFSGVAVQVVRTAMLIHAIHAALEDAEKAFNRVRMRRAAHVFFRAVIDALVIREVLTDLHILPRFVSHQGRGVGYVFGQLPSEGSARNIIDVEGAHLSGTLDKGEHRFLVAVAAANLSSRLATDEGFVSFDYAADASQDLARRVHRFAQAVRHEPCGFVLHPQRALQLVATAPFLAGTDQVDRLHPLVQRDLASFKDCANRYRELFAAVLALVHARAVRLAIQRIVILAYAAAVGADRAIGPADGFKVLSGLGGVLEMGFVEGGHGRSP